MNQLQEPEQLVQEPEQAEQEQPLPAVPVQEELPIPLERMYSAAYRQASNSERLMTENIMADYACHANAMMADQGIDYSAAMAQVDPNWAEHQWTVLPIKEGDLQPGDEVFSTKPPVLACNSKLNGMYNDTVALTDESAVTYRVQHNGKATHSGDIHTPYGDGGSGGLRHTVILNPNCEKTFVISTPWVEGQPRPVRLLKDTHPVFEVRTYSGDDMIRQVLGQNFSDGMECTACVNARVTKMNENLWKIEILRQFLPTGYADDIVGLHTSVANP